MRLLIGSLITTLLVCPCVGNEGDVKWLRFSKTFVQSHYAADAAVGEIVVAADGAQPAKTVHKRSCSGDDGELHIGILNESLSPSNAKAPSFSELSNDDAWGLVAELPNAALGDGPAQLADAVSKRIIFHGYFRVWNEGHDHGATPPSNPHHVFEVHPAWRFIAQGTEFDEPSLVKSIPAYSGYGITKLRPLFTSLADGEWLTAYGDGDDVFVSLRERPRTSSSFPSSYAPSMKRPRATKARWTSTPTLTIKPSSAPACVSSPSPALRSMGSWWQGAGPPS